MKMIQKRNYKRRSIRAVAAIGAVGLTLGLVACTGGEEDKGQIVIANWGGAVREAFEEAYFNDFTADTGIEVVSADGDVARYVQMSEAGESEWDSIDADGFADVDWIDRGIVQAYADDVPRSPVIPEKYQPYLVGAYTQSFVLAYRESALETEPTSWADFWDVEGFEGVRGWPGSYPGTAEPALVADGVPSDEIYPLDLDRAFAKLDEIKPHLTIYESYAAAQQGLQAGSVDMVLLPNGRVTPMMAEDDDIKIMWNENIFFPWNGHTISAGSQNVEAMNQLGMYMQDPARQAKFAELTGYGPTVEGALELISPEIAVNLPGTDEHMENVVVVDAVALAAQTDEYIERFSAWLAG